MGHRILSRLLWKDVRTILPLAFAVAIGIAGLHLLLLVFHYAELLGNRTRQEITLAVCVMFPLLFAFGSGAMLVGTEEESGSLSWLRTLPASWRSVATSKLLVAIGGLLLLWSISGLGLLAQRVLATDILATDGTPRSVWIGAILAQLFFSFALVLCSFLSAYLFRSPIVALLASVPIMIGLLYTFIIIIESIVPSTVQYQAWTDLPAAHKVSLFLLFAIGFAALFSAGAWAARRRLSGPDRRAGRSKAMDSAVEAFRPPREAPASWYGVTLVSRRPSPVAALLWQSLRQSFWPALAATIAGCVFAVIAVQMLPSTGFANLAPMFVALAVFTLSGVTFYGDSVKRRCKFFADRGFSPTLVWATRVVPPLLGILLIVSCYLVAAISRGHASGQVWLNALGIVGGFSFCQLISQSSKRPILAFLGAPVALYLFAAAFGPLVYFYFDHIQHLAWAFLPIIPILLFASWFLTDRWMQGRLGTPYAVRCLMFVALAIFVPYALVIGGRWVTTPNFDPRWVSEMSEFPFPQRGDGERPLAINLSRSNPLKDGAHQRMSMQSLGQEPSESELELFEKEMASSESIGAFLTPLEVYSHMTYFAKQGPNELIGGYPNPESIERVGDGDGTALGTNESSEQQTKRGKERDLRGAAILLRWSNQIRQEAIYGSASFDLLLNHSERAEYQVARMLRDYLDHHGVDDEVVKLVDQFPDQGMVKQSRISGLVREWQFSQMPYYTRRMLSVAGKDRWPAWLSFEERRSQVPVNAVVRSLLDTLRNSDDGYFPGATDSPQAPEINEVYYLGYIRNVLSRRDWAVAKLRLEVRQTREEAKS